jgi:hypothetical protein
MWKGGGAMNGLVALGLALLATHPQKYASQKYFRIVDRNDLVATY